MALGDDGKNCIKIFVVSLSWEEEAHAVAFDFSSISHRVTGTLGLNGYSLGLLRYIEMMGSLIYRSLWR